jgi:hypothetical protein
MKTRLLNIFLIVFVGQMALQAQSAKLNAFYNQADALFKKHVADGKVNYKSLVQNPTELNALYALAGEIQVDKSDALNYQAFWINAYNLGVIKAVADAYPIASPMDIPGFFDKKEHFFGGQTLTLNYLENTLLRGNFDEARYHFVLVCGAISCPPIVNFAYTPEKLDAQMQKQAKLALNNNSFIRVNAEKEKVELSEIFKWYREDFAKNNKGLIEYINAYRIRKIPTDYKVSFYAYDWTLNKSLAGGQANASSGILNSGPNDTEDTEVFGLQTFTAGSLLPKGRMDFTLFNTLYTEKENNWKGQDFTGYRTTFLTSLLQWTYGVSENARVNLGFDVYLRSTGRANGDSSISAIDRAFLATNTDTTSFGIAAIGPRIKIAPIKGVNNFSIQSTFLVSPANDPEGLGSEQHWLEWDRFIWWNQFFFDKTLGSRDQFQLFLEADVLFRFKRREYQTSHVDMPASVFFSYFPTDKITVYVMSQYWPRFVYDTPTTDENFNDIRTDWVIGSNYTASGIGFKYQFSSQLNVELLYTDFWRGTNSGVGQTFNLGIKYITR